MPLLELCGAVWVIEHLAAVLIVCAVSGLLSTALAVVVFRQARIRDDRRMTLWREAWGAERAPAVRRATVRAVVVPPELLRRLGDLAGYADDADAAGRVLKKVAP